MFYSVYVSKKKFRVYVSATKGKRNSNLCKLYMLYDKIICIYITLIMISFRLIKRVVLGINEHTHTYKSRVFYMRQLSKSHMSCHN